MEEIKKISHDKFHAMMERIVDNGHPLTEWYPDWDEAMELVKDPVGNYEFIIWILESNPDRVLTEEQTEVEILLQDTLRQCTQFC